MSMVLLRQSISIAVVLRLKQKVVALVQSGVMVGRNQSGKASPLLVREDQLQSAAAEGACADRRCSGSGSRALDAPRERSLRRGVRGHRERSACRRAGRGDMSD